MVSDKVIKDEALKIIDRELEGNKIFEESGGHWKNQIGPDVFNHSSRVCDFALILAEKYRLDLYLKEQIAIGSILHDIGKGWVNQKVLYKEGILNGDDRALINNHPFLGHKNLKNKNFSSEVLSIILNHHERLDGGGYPEGLFERDIPIYVQLVSVADEYEAITAERVYHAARSPAEAFRIMESEQGLSQLAVRCLKQSIRDMGIEVEYQPKFSVV